MGNFILEMGDSLSAFDWEISHFDWNRFPTVRASPFSFR